MKAAALHELERVEWRVLGALRPVDGVTGMPLGRDCPALEFVGANGGPVVEPGAFDLWLSPSAQTGTAARFTLVR